MPTFKKFHFLKASHARKRGTTDFNDSSSKLVVMWSHFVTWDVQGIFSLFNNFLFKWLCNFSNSRVVCRQQHSLHRDFGPAESPAAHGQSGRFGFPGGPRRGGGSSLRWTAALLQHTLPTVNRTPGSRGGRAQWQVRHLAWWGAVSRQSSVGVLLFFSPRDYLVW